VNIIAVTQEVGRTAVACTNYYLMPAQQDQFRDEMQLQVLRRLNESPELSQRAMAKELGVSLGSVNHCFKALVEKGWVKVQNFGRSSNKLGYVYLLTPSGEVQKSVLTALFLKRKLGEYEALKREIEELRQEVGR